MSIIESAKRELKAANVGEEDSRVMVEILEKFFGQWDSGGAVWAMAPVLQRLIAGKPLCPITGADSEWVDRSDVHGQPMWQNMRCSSIFKDGTGRAWDIDAADNDATIAFPYLPDGTEVKSPVAEFG